MSSDSSTLSKSINLIDSDLSKSFENLKLDTNERSLILESEINLFSGVVSSGLELFEILKDRFPKVLAKEIFEYASTNPMQYSYDQIIEELCKDDSISPICKSLISVQFETVDDLERTLLDKEFMINLANHINEFQLKSSYLFSVNLRTFILKSLLIMRQKYPNIYGLDQEKWEKIIENMKLLESDLRQIDLKDFTKNLEWNFNFPNYGNVNFFRIECLRKWKNNLEPRFKGLLNDLYSKEGGSYFAIISKYFNGGKLINEKEGISFEDFKSYLNRNPLLAFLWYSQDSSSWKKCFNSLTNSNSSYSNTKEEIEKFKSKRDEIFTIVFGSSPLYDLESDLRLVVKNNHKILFGFQNPEQQNLFKVLKALDNIDRLTTWKNILNVFHFIRNSKDLGHSELKNLLEKEIKIFGSEKFPIYIKAKKLLDNYERLKGKKLKF